MAVGDIVEALASVADDGFLTIQPGAGKEWMVANIYHAGAAELYKYDGTNTTKIDEDAAGGAWCSYKFFLTNDIYLRVKNVSGGAAIVGYDGVEIQ